MISTIHSSRLMETKKIDPSTNEKIKKPTCVLDYNKFMMTDRADNYLSYYSLLRRTKKWTKRTVIYFLNAALYNAFQVFKKLNSSSKKSYKVFLHEVAKEWIADQTPMDEDPGPSISRDSKSDHPGRLSRGAAKHEIVKIDNVKKLQKQCRLCSKYKKKSRTTHMCKFCKIPLHQGECFFKYHTETY